MARHLLPFPMTELFIVLGAAFLSFALRSTGSRPLRKLGALGILAATYLAFYYPTGSVAAGLGGLSIWFLLPWVELLTRIRRLRLPAERSLESQAPPGRSRFPDLEGITDEVEAEGFDHVADAGWEWDGMSQFYRIFYHPGERIQAAVCLTEQGGLSWASLSATSRLPGGRVLRTTDVPFSSPMKLAPEVSLRQLPSAESFSDLLEEHRLWMSGLGYEAEDLASDAPENLAGLIEQETGRQLHHNLEQGLICPAEGAGTLRYSWRGLIFLYFQLLKDMVKLS